MPRHWKNSDDVNFYTEKSTEARLEKLRKEFIKGYVEKKRYSNTNKKKNNGNISKRDK